MKKLRKEFCSDLESVNAAVRGLSVTAPSGQADLTLLFRMAAHEAKKSRAQNRIFRLVGIACYCMRIDFPHEHARKQNKAEGLIRVSSFSARFLCTADPPLYHSQWPVNQRLFTFDVIYLHNKPSPDNCPQEVYEVLVDAVKQVSEYEGDILESGQALSRILFHLMCMMLSHPQQRCSQDYLGIPKSRVRETLPADSVPISSQ
ncbi:hypothetical protein MLD38_014676 [Melastoma candidum]|uniref:Uncharacterized protein n=1 Tax=Melastoma candidum TaxID=119954 RepID=A0ACB9RD57_9MYRT|nr:hypothetical protein MLD38_014676 [Melastoma candidum]